MGSIKNLIGQKFGWLTVIEYIGNNHNRKAVWKCVCDCGSICNVISINLINSNTKSCGCYKLLRIKESVTKHGESKTRFYKVWLDMKARCFNPNKVRYSHYGGRGIKVCDSWLKFENFYRDMYESYLDHVKIYGEKQTTIDRVNVNGNYCPENCKWATYKEQNSNTRKNKPFRAISPIGQEYTANNQAEFANIHNLMRQAINKCLNRRGKTHKGWTFKYI